MVALSVRAGEGGQWSVGSLVGLPMEGPLTGESSAVPRSWLTLGWVVLPGSAGPQDVKTSNTETRICG